jgi:hypothetical protein
MKRGKLIALIENGACAAVIGLALMAFSTSSAKAQQPPRTGCVAVSKSEYASANRQKLLRIRYGAYVRTGRPLRGFFWYCR